MARVMVNRSLLDGFWVLTKVKVLTDGISSHGQVAGFNTEAVKQVPCQNTSCRLSYSTLHHMAPLASVSPHIPVIPAQGT